MKQTEGIYSINGLGGVESLYNEATLAQQAQWAREDKIRQEQMAREDTAYQRAVEDARKAGINPNLIDIQPAGTGSGITNATGMDKSLVSNQMTIDADAIQNEAQREFERIMALDEHEREKEIQRIQNEFEKTYKDIEAKINNRNSIWGNINDSVAAFAQFFKIGALASLIG